MKKIAIVTGGSSGIGRAAALMLCENGYTVYEFSRRGENYSSIFHITADVTNPASIAAAAAKVIEKEGRIDLLVNNAGFGISGPVEFTDPARCPRPARGELLRRIQLYTGGAAADARSVRRPHHQPQLRGRAHSHTLPVLLFRG